MAKIKRAETCMFCGTSPCSCGKPAASKPEVPTQVAEIKDVKQVVQQPANIPMVKYSNTILTGRPKIGQVDGVTAYAVEVLILSGIVLSDDIPMLRSRMGRVPDVELKRKAGLWRKRNGKA